MQTRSIQDLTLGALTAALYAALTLALPGSFFGFRVAEALTVLPFLFPATAPGLVVGCLIANLLSPYGLVDLICGTAATGLAAILTAKMPNQRLAPLPPVLCNGVIVGGMLSWYQGGFGPNFLPLLAVTVPGVAFGELLTCYLLGGLLLKFLPSIPYIKEIMTQKPPK